MVSEVDSLVLPTVLPLGCITVSGSCGSWWSFDAGAVLGSVSGVSRGCFCCEVSTLHSQAGHEGCSGGLLPVTLGSRGSAASTVFVPESGGSLSRP